MNKEQIVTRFRTYLITERRFSHNTVAAYVADVEQFVHFFEEHELSLEKYTKGDVLSFLSSLKLKKLAAASLCRKVVVLKLFGSYLEDCFKIKNLMTQISTPKLEQLLPTYLTEAETEQLLAFIQTHIATEKGFRNYLIIMLLYSAGLRVSELLSLKPGSFRFDTGFVEVIGKRGTQRAVPLPPQVLDAVQQFVITNDKKEWLFTSTETSEKPLTRQQCWNIVKDAVLKAGITKDISPHSLRHSLATHFLGRGMDVRSLQVFLGHQSVDTVEVYTHVDRTGLRAEYEKSHPRK
jgi:integrase/recombinase XerD